LLGEDILPQLCLPGGFFGGNQCFASDGAFSQRVVCCGDIVGCRRKASDFQQDALLIG
jgi:hypothetical protein